MNKLSIYVHTPFCKQKCFYCDFASFQGQEKNIEDYFKCLNMEIRNSKNKYEDRIIDTIYFGGGTPSYVDSKLIAATLETIKDNYRVSKNAEITIEANPESITSDKLSDYLNKGFNRISMGLQSANDCTLKRIGRIHSFEKFIESYELARKIGFKNINIDLMFSLPGETLNDFNKSLDEIIKLNPEHISTYSLILEEGTKLYSEYKNNEFYIDDELDRKMYHHAFDRLADHGYHLYEISNFSKPGYESRHNLNCWNFIEYVGFGSNASSYINDCRIKNISDIQRYMDKINNNKSPVEEIIKLTYEDTVGEYIILALRKTEGLCIDEFDKKFNLDFEKKYNKEINKLQKQNLVEIKNRYFRLTKAGLDFANTAMIEFI